MKNDRENFCREAFDRFLREYVGIKNIEWAAVPNGEDPPDFYVKCGQETFAVEVTSTEVMRDATIGEGQVREETYEASHTRLVQTVETLARQKGTLDGAYAIIFCRPLTVSRFQQLKRVVIKALLDHIELTRHESTSPSEEIYYEHCPVCRIQKLHNRPSGVYEVFTDSAWVETFGVAKEACDMLQLAVLEKKARFEHIGELAPKILLLLNTYAFTSPQIYQSCIAHVKDWDFFHSIFIVWGDGSGFFIHAGDFDM